MFFRFDTLCRIVEGAVLDVWVGLANRGRAPLFAGNEVVGAWVYAHLKGKTNIRIYPLWAHEIFHISWLGQ